jgi:hypothetical protein
MREVTLRQIQEYVETHYIKTAIHV